MRIRCLLAGAVLPLSLAAQDTTTTKASLMAAERSAISNAATLRQALTPAATVLLPDRPILHGASMYESHLAEVSPDRGTIWTSVHAVVAPDGGFGCTTGIVRRPIADAAHPSAGRYVACWRRGRGGDWRIVALSVLYAPAAVRSLPDTLAAPPGSTGVRGMRRARAAQAMADADRAFARFSADSGGPAGAFSRWIAADGMMIGIRDVPVRGPAQVREAFAPFPPHGRFEWGPIDSLARSSRDGSLGFTIGEARKEPTPGTVSYSKYLTVWRHEPDGTYRFIFDTGSDRPAPVTR